MDKSPEIQHTLASLDLSDLKEEEKFTEELEKQESRCKELLEELEVFLKYMKGLNRVMQVDSKHFKNLILSELKLLEKVRNTENTNRVHALRSNNLPFLNGVWSTAKNSKDVISLGRRFHPSPTTHLGPKQTVPSARVDIVTQNGLEWVKIFTLTERRMIYNLAKAGIYAGSSDESASEDAKDEEPEGLFKQAQILVRASRANRVGYRLSKIRIVLTRITKDCHRQIADHIAQIRALGIVVQTADELPAEPLVSTVLSQMGVNPFASFSETLNIDCTVLLAFVSDLSHGRVESADWHHKAISRQIEMETSDQLLPNFVWPACSGRKLICSREAAIRMHEIVNLIGTETEKARTNLLVEVPSTSGLTHEERISEFQKLSSYPIPLDWQLPIQVIDVNLDIVRSTLPPFAEAAFEVLKSLNQSVFLYGWAMGLTTISSNRTVVKELNIAIEGSCIEDEDGPNIWLCPTARSLVGKEKDRRPAAKHSLTQGRPIVQ